MSQIDTVRLCLGLGRLWASFAANAVPQPATSSERDDRCVQDASVGQTRKLTARLLLLEHRPRPCRRHVTTSKRSSKTASCAQTVSRKMAISRPTAYGITWMSYQRSAGRFGWQCIIANEEWSGSSDSIIWLAELGELTELLSPSRSSTCGDDSEGIVQVMFLLLLARNPLKHRYHDLGCIEGL